MTALKITPDSMYIMPTADGGSVLRASGTLTDADGNAVENVDAVRVVLSNAQTNAILAGLLGVATIKILPENEA